MEGFKSHYIPFSRNPIKSFYILFSRNKPEINKNKHTNIKANKLLQVYEPQLYQEIGFIIC